MRMLNGLPFEVPHHPGDRCLAAFCRRFRALLHGGAHGAKHLLAGDGANQLQRWIGGEPVASEVAAAVNAVLLAAAQAGDPAVLSALLDSHLPWDLTAREPHGWMPNHRGYSLLAVAAMSPQPDACVRLLSQAGAVPTAADLYCAIDSLCPDGVAALLTCGAPPVDTSQPAATAPLLAPERNRTAWSCPIHRTLHGLKVSGCMLSLACAHS